MFRPSTPLYVNEALLVSSVGLDAATAAASIRAGLSRPAPLHGFAVVGEDDEETVVSGHPIALLTAGFEGAGRYRQLLERILGDLHTTLAAEKADTAERPLYLLLGVPDRRRYSEGTDVESGEPLGEEDDAFTLYGATWESLLKSALERVGLAGRFAATQVRETSIARSAELLQLAHRALEGERRARVALVLVDTLSDTAGLTWFHRTGRLRTALFPVGACPGEGAAALLLSCERDAGALCLDWIEQAEERDAQFAEEPPEGKALAALLERFLETHERDRAHPWLLSNASGEERPFFEWAMARVHCLATSGTSIESDPELPAMAVGEVGIAFVAMAMALVMQAHERGYAPRTRCAIVLGDHSGARALVAVSAA